MSDSVADELWRKAVSSVFLTINKISLASSIVLTISIGFFIILKFQAAERLSLRLYFWLALCDILTHAPLLVKYIGNNFVCQIVNNIVFFANFLTVMITTVMAVNLHLVFLRDRPDLVKSERFYIIGCTLISFVLTLPLIGLAIASPESCPYYLQFEFPYDRIGLFFLFGNWILIPTLYCFYVFISIILKLTVPGLGSSFSSDGSVNGRQNKFIVKRMVIRLMLYPLVPVITMLPYLIVIAIDGYPSQSNVGHFFNYFAATVQGILNLAFFLFDPALPSLWQQLKERIRDMTPRKTNDLPVDAKSTSCELNELPPDLDAKFTSVPPSIDLNRYPESIDQVELIRNEPFNPTRLNSVLANPRLLI